MKIRAGFIIKELAGKYIIIPEANENLDLSSLITFNKTAKVLFESLKEERTVDELVDLLCERFEVEREVAKKDVLAFVAKLRSEKLLEGE